MSGIDWQRQNRNRSTLRCASLLVGVFLSLLALDAVADVVEPEIRCCFSVHDFKTFENNFAITLQGDELPIGHLRLTTPSGEMLGFDNKSGQFRSVTRHGVYALFPASELPIEEPLPHRSSPRAIVLFSLEPGEYRVDVVAQRSGRYSISFDPVGIQAKTYSKSFNAVSIKAGETHRYLFPGKFTNPRDGSAPLSDPNAFRVRRAN